MQIVINVDDKEKLLDALNNSIIAFGDIVSSFYVGCELPKKWNDWMLKNMVENNKSYDDCYKTLSERYKLLKDIYWQIEGDANADSN